MAVTLSWVLALAMVLAAAATALYIVRITKQQQAQAEEQARQTVAAAEENFRAEAERAAREAERGAREAASAAVRSFGTSVVSLGADVSQIVSAALREHRDDEIYETLTRIDHSVQQMIRQAQSYVILCGGLPGRRWPAQTLTDIVGGATSRVRDYPRVRSQQIDRVVISRAVEPLAHTLATLLDNALRYSPPTAFVDVAFQEGHHGVTVIVDDAGIRMNNDQLEEARSVLAGERTVDLHRLGPSPKVGFPGIAALAQRYGFTVYIDGPNSYGGMRAMVYIPETLLVPQPTAVPEEIPTAPATGELALVTGAHAAEEPAPTAPGETTGNGLPKRRRSSASPGVSRLPDPQQRAPKLELARADIAAAWQTGSRSGRAAVDDNDRLAEDHAEGMTQ